MTRTTYVRIYNNFLLKYHQAIRTRPCYSADPLFNLDVQLRRFSTKDDTIDRNNNIKYSRDTSIYHPLPLEIDDEKLAKNVRSCIRGHRNQQGEEEEGGTGTAVAANRVKDTGMSICFLGTSAGHPTRFRSTSATLLRLGGRSLLFDAGEGVQRQLDFTRAKPSHIEQIFITHLHGDHIFGLPGFLLFLQNVFTVERKSRIATAEGKASQKKGRKGSFAPPEHTINIYGPPGLYNYIAANIVFSCAVFRHVKIVVHELIGGRVKRVKTAAGQRNPFDSTFDEFSLSCLIRKKIRCQDGVWNIDDYATFNREDILAGTTKRCKPYSANAIRIRAAEVDHVPGVVTFGYVVEEQEPPRNVDGAKANELGIPSGKKMDLLKHGYSVMSEDGSREVQPEEVWAERKRRARKVAIIGDNRGWTPELESLAQDADVLVHEATLEVEDYRRGHSTASMAGVAAKKVNAAVLVLHHISSRYSRSGHAELVEDAKKSAGERSTVAIAYDFMEILVPWVGFRPLPQENDEKLVAEEESTTTTAAAEGGEKSTTQRAPVHQVVRDWFKSIFK